MEMTLYRVRGAETDADGAEIECGRVKYWTGEMRGRWPIYLKDKGAAGLNAKATAERMAAAFNLLDLPYLWSVEPVES